MGLQIVFLGMLIGMVFRQNNSEKNVDENCCF